MSDPASAAPPAATAGLRGRVAVVLVLQCVVVLLCVGVTTLLAVTVQERSIRAATVDRVLDVARSLAGLDQVIQAVQDPREEATAELQPLADIIAQSSGVDYVVVTDDHGIRITHPTPAERGREVSTDVSGVLSGETFVGTETGTIGPTLRAKVPIHDGDRIVGAASVGILESSIAEEFTVAVGGLIPWVIGSVVVGLVASAALTSLFRRRVARLEGEARELRSQRRITEALRDQTHEFHTRLHVIRGLVAEGQDADALDYIGGIVPVTTARSGSADGIRDPRVRAILAAAAASVAGGTGALEVDPDSTVPAESLDDDDLTVIGNLSRNAADAAQSRVHVRVESVGGRVTLVVGDDGPGIDPRDTARIFDRGVSSKGAQRGVGLDLVRRVVGERGGYIEVGVSPWGGAQFTVEMPAAPRSPARDAS